MILENSSPSPFLVQLLEIVSLKHDGSLASIVEVTQQEWVHKIRPPGIERWQVNPNIIEFFEQKRAFVLPLLSGR